MVAKFVHLANFAVFGALAISAAVTRDWHLAVASGCASTFAFQLARVSYDRERVLKKFTAARGGA